jgi:alginate O-acetyltransferase complex protein AlgI
VDVYRGTTPACRNLRDFLLFKTFFPQLVAGPIERANHLLPQIQQPRRVNNSDIIEGLYLVLWGYCKKVVVADNLALKVNRIFDGGTLTAGDVTLGAIGFAFQIYADFSGYTDIARGVARWFGISLSENFRYPYFATNPRDFWRRWHISLSTWLREYLYIPLGGNRRGPLRTYINIFITMLLGGLWHGAAWNFILWGAYQGILLMAHRAWTQWRGERRHTHFTRVCSIAVMFAFTLYGWLLFRLGTFAQISAATHALVGFDGGGDFLVRLLKMMPYIGLILLVDTASFLARDPWLFVRRHPVLVAGFFLVLFYTILILGVAGGEQFIYFAF